MGELVILTAAGDERLEWDPADKDSVKVAYDRFEVLKKEGCEFYEVEEVPGRQVKRFNAKAGRLLAAPGARSAADKEKERRPRAMAGGPVNSAASPAFRL